MNSSLFIFQKCSNLHPPINRNLFWRTVNSFSLDVCHDGLTSGRNTECYRYIDSRAELLLKTQWSYPLKYQSPTKGRFVIAAKCFRTAVTFYFLLGYAAIWPQMVHYSQELVFTAACRSDLGSQIPVALWSNTDITLCNNTGQPSWPLLASIRKAHSPVCGLWMFEMRVCVRGCDGALSGSSRPKVMLSISEFVSLYWVCVRVVHLKIKIPSAFIRPHACVWLFP